MEKHGRGRWYRVGLSFGLGPLLLALATQAAADPVTVTARNSFGSGTAGASPGVGAPTLGADGNLYGPTSRGGGSCDCGALYKLAPDGTLTQLYAFLGNGDGAEPYWGFSRDSAGNFYGMADPDSTGTNRGTVFKLSKSGVFSVLYAFPFDASQGWTLRNAITVGADGNLYGVTYEGGGASAGCGNVGCGVVFRMKTDGSAFTVLYRFPGTPSSPGYGFGYPEGGLAQGPDGNFYGLTLDGNNQYGLESLGSLYRITPAGVVTQLYQFTDRSLGNPVGKPTLDAAGNLYIVATGNTSTGANLGFIHELDTGGVLHTLHAFTVPEGEPGVENSALLLGKDGRLYGTTYTGGLDKGAAAPYGYGTVFSIDGNGTFATLYNFTDNSDGFGPGGLVTAKDGSLWGTTFGGGTYASGVAFQLAKPTMKLSIWPLKVKAGSSAALKWSSTEVSRCATSGAWGLATVAGSGSQVVAPATTGTYSYTLTCSGAGSVSRTVKLTVD